MHQQQEVLQHLLEVQACYNGVGDRVARDRGDRRRELCVESHETLAFILRELLNVEVWVYGHAAKLLRGQVLQVVGTLL